MHEAATAEVVIVVVSYNGRDYMRDCLGSVLASDDGPLRKHIILIDNASQDGSLEYVREHFPQVTAVDSGANLGFAAANNLAWELARERCPAVEFLYLLNQDTRVESGWLRPLVDYLRSHEGVGSLQSKLLLHPRIATVNTAGNRSHFLGFGFPDGYGKADGEEFDTPRSINYASGAGVIVRAELVRQVGLFEPEMFMYLEDADLSWKIRQLGHDVRLLPESRVYHKYKFNSDYRFYYHLERNRWWLLMVYYRFATLGALAPALTLMELGQCFFAAKHGRLSHKLRAYGFFLRPKNVRRIWRLRRAAQRRRTIPDREFLRDFTDTIDSPELKGFLVRGVANPVFKAYWKIAKRLIVW